MNTCSIDGRWVAAMPHDSDDYRIEYVVSSVNGLFRVSARDLTDEEEMEVSDVSWDGSTLSFRSLMPSTGRVGINRFRLTAADKIESEFTFTVQEELVRRSAT